MKINGLESRPFVREIWRAKLGLDLFPGMLRKFRNVVQTIAYAWKKVTTSRIVSACFFTSKTMLIENEFSAVHIHNFAVYHLWIREST